MFIRLRFPHAQRTHDASCTQFQPFRFAAVGKTCKSVFSRSWISAKVSCPRLWPTVQYFYFQLFLTRFWEWSLEVVDQTGGQHLTVVGSILIIYAFVAFAIESWVKRNSSTMTCWPDESAHISRTSLFVLQRREAHFLREQLERSYTILYPVNFLG